MRNQNHHWKSRKSRKAGCRNAAAVTAGKIGSILLAALTCLLVAGAFPGTGIGAAAVSADSSYPSDPENPATIPIEQKIENGSGNETIRYVLTPKTDEGDADAPMPEGTENGSYTFSLTGSTSGSIVIPNAGKAGTWYYSLKMDTPLDEGATPDVTGYRLGVQYYYSSDGTLKANINALAEGADASRKARDISFTVTFPEPEMEAGIGDPSVTKYIDCVKTGSDGRVIRPNGDVEFHFTITPFDEADQNDSAYPMPEGSENGSKTLAVVVKAGRESGSKEFGDIRFTEAGTYNYRIVEEKESLAGFSYDETVYRVEYVVEPNDAGTALDAERTIYRVSGTSGSEKTEGRDVATFSNKYNPDTAAAKTTGKASGTSGKASTAYTHRVKTGDSTNAAGYIALLAAACAALVILGVWRKKREAQ